MRTKLYVLGAVLGVAPGLVPVVSTLFAAPSQEARQDARGASRKSRGAGRTSPAPAGSNHDNAGVAAPAGATTPGAPTHPCELITVMKVPCDADTATCEYTYWQCPEAVKPLKA